MDSVFEAYLGQDTGILSEPDDIPKTNDPVWILGKQYNAIQGKHIDDDQQNFKFSTKIFCKQNWKR